jgi:hypothetical protein
MMVTVVLHRFLVALDGQSGSVKWAASLGALAPGILGSNQPIVAGNGVIVLATFVHPVPGQGSVTSLTEFSTVDDSVVWTRSFGD